MEWDKDDLDHERKKLREEAELRRRQLTEGTERRTEIPTTLTTAKPEITPNKKIRDGVLLVAGGIIGLVVLISIWDIFFGSQHASPLHEYENIFTTCYVIFTLGSGLVYLLQGIYLKWKERRFSIQNATRDL